LEIWSSPERLEAPRLLSIGYPRETISGLGPRSWKTLTSLGALSLCAFIFAFSGEDAQAQQQHTITDGQVAETATEMPLKAPPAEETSPQETRPVNTSPAGSALPDSETMPGQTLQPELISGSTPVPTEHYGSESPTSDPALPGLVGGDPGSSPTLDSVPPNAPAPTPGPLDPEPSTLVLEPAPGAATTEQDEPLSLLAEEAPAAELAPPDLRGEEGPYLLPVLGGPVTSTVDTLEATFENPTANALESVTGEGSWPAAADESLNYTASLADLFSGGETERAPASEPAQEPSPTGSESPLRDTPPQPVSPFTPPVVNSFSLSGAQVGSGGVFLLLLCVLASGPILLRRDLRLSWAYCKLPKPISAVRLPLERPG
jgi:hypothetical protein